MDYEVPRWTRRCHRTERDLSPGEVYYTVLIEAAESDEIVRLDFARDAWTGPPENALAWWKSRAPTPSDSRMQWAPNDAMLQLFDALESQPEKQDMRYVLALLLVRRRIMRSEGEELDDAGRTAMHLYCPRRDTTHEAAVVMPTQERIDAIQAELAELLFAKPL